MVTIEFNLMKGCENLGKRQDLENDFVDIHINLPVYQYSLCKKLAKDNWMSVSSIIRRAVTDWLEASGLLIKK